MKLHEPINNFNPEYYPKGDVTQRFAENPALYKQCCNIAGHNGWDIVRAHGTPIYAVAGGKCVEAKEDTGGNGKHVRILTETDEWIYGHFSRIDVKVGDPIERGQQIGLMGNTGFTISEQNAGGYWKYNPYAGTHVHITRYPLVHWNGTGSYNREYSTGDRVLFTHLDNGYNGAVDYSPEDFDLKNPVVTIKASDEIALFAAKKQASGQSVQATQLFALSQFLRAFGY